MITLSFDQARLGSPPRATTLATAPTVIDPTIPFSYEEDWMNADELVYNADAPIPTLWRALPSMVGCGVRVINPRYQFNKALAG